MHSLPSVSSTASLVWEYPGAGVDDPWFNQGWGDADRLPNGNTLVTAGTVLESGTQSRIFELTPDGEAESRV